MERAGAAALGTATATAAAMPSPVVWNFFGYPFEAASMIAAVFAAVVTRIIINTRNRSSSRTLDMAVLALVLVTTVTLVAGLHANLVQGLLYGTGIATIGEGLLRIAEKYVNKGLAFLDVPTPPPAPPVAMPVQTPPISEDGAAISKALNDLNQVD